MGLGAEMVIGATGDVRLREVCDDLIKQKSGGHIGIRSSARKPLVHAAIGFASVAMAGGAAAQEALPTIDVSGQGQGQSQESPDNTLQSTFGGISRIPGTVQDIPQTINVINQQTLQQQGVTTVDQALRNVPRRYPASSGEGGGGQNGDQFRIRGFQAKSDLYVDGLRDFGGYIRDAFSIEQIQVLKGPASESFGYGTTGGAINLQQKTAKLGNFTDIEGVVGMGPLGRVVADINKQIGQTTAMRIVGMYHDQDLVDRDHLFSRSLGLSGITSVSVWVPEPSSRSIICHQSRTPPPRYGNADRDSTTHQSRRPGRCRNMACRESVLRQEHRQRHHQRRYVHGAFQA